MADTNMLWQRPPFGLKGIDHVLLLVQGMPTALTFYREVLGCLVENELPQYAMVQLRAGQSLIDLVDVGAPEGCWAVPDVAGGRNMDHICIGVSEFDEMDMRAHLARHAIAIVEEGIHAGANGESLSLYIKDPSGNVVELKAPPERQRPHAYSTTVLEGPAR